MKKLFVFILPVLFIFSCSDDDSLSYEEQLAKDIKKIEKYLNENDLVAQKTNSGLHYIIEQEGNGVYPKSTSTIKVKYSGKFLSGVVFDTNSEPNGSFFIMNGSIIVGWKEGMKLFSIGGKGKLLIPSGLGYGAYKSGSIPANSVLIFDVELVNIF